MAIYAAMIDRMDVNIGRVINDLKAHGELENTLVVFVSDNGACAEWDPFGFDIKSSNQNILHRGEDLERMGGEGTFHSAGSGWANASNTPFRLYKHYCHQGGVLSPCIVHWPAAVSDRAGTLCPMPTHLIDLFPTVLAAAKAEYPDQHHGRQTTQLPGRNLIDIVRTRHVDQRTVYLEHEGNRGLRRGEWKLVAMKNGPWELYDLSDDPIEQRDLAQRYPHIVRRLAADWKRWAADNQVTPLPADYQVAYLKGVIPRAVGEVRKLAGSFRFTEGPAWDRAGGWYFSDIPNKRLHHWSEADGVQLIRTGKQASNGVVVDRQGSLVFCEVGGRRIVRRHCDGRETTLADACEGKPIGMPNDVWIAPGGDIYFTIPKTNKRRGKFVPADAVNGTVCLIPGDGSTVRDVGVGLRSTNGIIGSADGRRLYVTDPGSQKCWRYEIKPDGSLSNRQLAATKGSDGLALDRYGNLYTTSKEGVVVFSPQAEPIATITVPESPANMAFGGHDGKTLFITARTAIYSVPMNVRGDLP
jgi:sugar lactone lactonase YvrE